MNLENLEERVLLARVFWNVDADGAWNVAGNWKDEFAVSRVPAAGDDVFLDRAAGPFTITHGSGADTVHSLKADLASFVLSGGSLAFAAGGTVDLAPGLFQWTGGQLGDGAGVSNVGSIALAGAGSKTLGGTLNDSGTITHGGPGGLSGGAINILAGGVYDLQGDSPLTSAVINAGTFRKSGGAGTVGLRPFTNLGGTIDVRAGVLAVDGSTLDGQTTSWTGGNFTVAQGATMDWIGENNFAHYELRGDYTGSGAGVVRLGTGRLRFAGPNSTINFSPGLFQWSGGSSIDGGTAGLTNLGTITLVGASVKILEHPLNNAGTIVHAGAGDITNGSSGFDTVITNLPGALYDIQTDVSIANNAQFDAFINRGTLRKSGGTGTSSIKSRSFRAEGGTVDVQQGILSIPNGGGTGGAFSVAKDAVADLTPAGDGFANGAYTGAYTGSGLGVVRLRASGNPDFGFGLHVAGATFNFPAGLFQWLGGTIDGGTAGFNNTGSITLAGAETKYFRGVLYNAGTVVHAGAGVLQTVGTPVFNNLPGGLYDLQGDSGFILGNGSGYSFFNNAGTIRKSSGAGAAGPSGAVDLRMMGGTIDVQSGLFTLNGFSSPNSAHTGGTFRVARGAVLELIGVPRTRGEFRGTYTGSGEGTILLEKGIVAAGEGGAVFDFAPGLFQWRGGIIDGGIAPLTNRGTITLPEFGLQPLFIGALNNAGTILDIGDATLEFMGERGNGVFTNLPAGVFEFRGDGGDFAPQGGNNNISTFLNQGTLLKSGPGTATIRPNVFSNTGTLTVDAGTLRVESTTVTQVTGNTLSAGTWRVAAGASIDLAAAPALTTNNAIVILDGPGSSFAKLDTLASNGGSLSLLDDRDFTTAGPLTNTGRLTIGARSALDVMGTFSQGAAATLSVQLGGDPASGRFGQLTSRGASTLDGTFDVALTGGFGPAAGQSFRVMSFPAHSGTFAAFTGLRSGRFPLFDATVTDTGVLLGAVSSTADLAFDAFDAASFPTVAMAGQKVTLAYRVKNLSALPAEADWIDSIYLSRDGVLDPDDALLARVEHHGGVAASGSYSETVTAALPALADGAYRAIVLADSRGLASDADRGNNTGVSTQAIAVTVPLLVLGTAVNGSIAPGQDLYYRVLVPPGEDVTVAAEFVAPPGAEVAVRYGALPDRTTFDDASSPGELHPRLLLTNVPGGSYYIHLRRREDATSAAAFTLKADASGFEVTRISPLRGSNLAAPAVLELQGSQFTPQTRVTLRMPGGQSRPAQSVQFINANRIAASIDLAGLSIGDYQVVAEGAGETAQASDAFTVTSNPAGETGAFIWLKILSSVILQTSQSVRTARTFRIAFGEFNTSDSPLPAPFYVVKATNVQPGEEAQGSLGTTTVPATLLPGNYRNDDVSIVAYRPKSAGAGLTSEFSLYVVEPTKDLIDWNAEKENLRPSMIPPDAWDAVWLNLRPQLGNTLADLYQLLTNDSDKLAESGESIDAISDLLNFEFQKANNLPAVPVPGAAVDIAFAAPGLPLVFARSRGETIAGRYQLGRLGRGWADNFDIAIHEDATTRLVTLTQAGGARYFKEQDDGSFRPALGEFATLTRVNGSFRLREPTGDLTVFRTDGLLDYLEDSNGNRITAGYTGGQLTSLTSSSGAALTLSYAGARLHQVTDPAGGVTTYEYDASGEHLVRVISAAGTSEYAYTTDLNGPHAHALASITFSDGTHLFFDYDSRGRLVRQQGDGGAGALRYAYDVASYRVTDANDRVTTYFYDDAFRNRRIVDPLGQVATIDYDDSNQPVFIGSAGGGASSLGYDSLGNPTTVQDPLGATQAFTYQPGQARLVAWKDALGHETQYQYDAKSNLTTTTQVDGSTTQYAYDAQGNVVSTADALGQNIGFTYNSAGQVTRKSLPDGTQVDYTYTARGNLETVVDATGTTRLEYHDAQNPDLLTRITYPNGRFLEYTYLNGRRTRMVDQGGFAVNYTYDAAGRFDVLRDRDGGLIVDYDYDPAGRLARETHGNGTVTENTYNDAGQVIKIVNRAPGGAVQSQIGYAYDNLGRQASMTTEAGVTTYGYDGAGRITKVTLPGGRIITYAYDAAGNRISSSDGGAVTTDTVNDRNQLVAVGSTRQTFDAAGNLVASSSPGGSTSYRYDAEGRLVSQIAPTGTWTYEYDSLGDRIASTHNGVRTEYLVDPSGLGNVVGEYDGTGGLQAHYVDGIGLTSRVDAAGTAAYYQFDALGSTTQLTGAGGAVLNSYSYLPFGESLSASESVPNPFAYVGQYGVMRDGSGIDYMRNRYYSPGQGRFTQEDPAGLAGGTNAYAYAVNNPVAFIDPSGLAYGAAIDLGVRLATGGFLGQSGGAAVNTLPASAAQTTFGTSAETQAILSEIKAVQAASAEQALARQAAQKAVQGPAFLRTALYATLAAEIVVLTNLHYQVQQLILKPGQFPACTPVIPKSLQACEDPGDSILEEVLELKFIQRLVITQATASIDPNEMVGPAGFGTEGFLIPQAPLAYTVHFQNDPSAPGPAEQVVVTHALDPDLDLDTFELNQFGFGDIVVDVPAGRQFFSTRLDLRSTRGVFVDLTAELDRATRTATWTFQAIDPETMDQPSDPTVGFLPPDKTAPEGQGFVFFSVRARAGLATGTRIDAQATIVFDTNAPIATNVFRNTVDVGAPGSTVAALPARSPASFTVRWAGQDDLGGSGIAFYDVFVSDNGGPASLWQSATTQVLAMYTGQDGHSYAFTSIATDNVGHQQSTPAAAQATTTVDAVAPSSGVNALPAASPATFTASWSGTDDPGGSGVASYDVYVSDNGGAFTAITQGTAQTSTSFTGTPDHTYGFFSVATDQAGNRQATPTTAQTSTRVSSAMVATSLTIRSSTSAAHPGEPVSFIATVAAQSGAALPSGAVQFQIDGAALGPAVALLNGSATSAAVSSLLVGTHTVTASYISDSPGFATSEGALAGGQVVNRGETALVVGSSPASSTYGQALSFTAVVSTSTAGRPSPSGSVQFLVDGAAFGQTVVLVNGSATLSGITVLPAGNHTIEASYSGSPVDAPSTATAASLLTVVKATPTLVWANPADIVAGIPLGVTQLNAAASVPGRFAYDPAAGTTLGAGSGQILTVVFTPADAVNYTTASGSVRINVTPSLPPADTTAPTVTGFRTTRRKGVLGEIVVTFSEAMTAAGAGSLGSYRLVSAGRDRRFGTRDDRVLAFRSASYDPTAREVKLTSRGRVALNQPLQLIASGSGALVDVALNALDGDRDGIAGRDFIGPLGAKPKASLRAAAVRVMMGDLIP